MPMNPQNSKTVHVIVGGRFHADRMARGLLRAGLGVELFTSFPRNRFPDLPPAHVHPHIFPEFVFRLLTRLGLENMGDIFKIKFLGRQVVRTQRRLTPEPDAIVAWSSFGLESFKAHPHAVKITVRDSAHIQEQMEWFAKEFEKLGVPFPNRAEVVDRELQEYERADHILVCSDFIRKTFLDRGVPAHKLHKISLGVNTSLFTPKPSYTLRPPLQVIYFGTISVYKGVLYLLDATKDIPESQLSLTLVGHVSPNFRRFVDRYSHVKISPPLPHPELVKVLKRMDVFVMPSLQDGFGGVVPQAMATGLVSIVSDHCGSHELIENGKNGFVIPCGEAKAIREKLLMLIENPSLVESIGRSAALSTLGNDWNFYEASVGSWIQGLPAQPALTEPGAALSRH